MIFNEEFIVKYPYDEAWEFFTDFPGPITVIPGLRYVKEVEPRFYVGEAQVKIGPFDFMFAGEARITQVDQKERRVIIAGGARDELVGAKFEATAYTQTLPHGANQSRVLLEVHVGMEGPLGKLGKFILKPRARAIVDKYRELCEAELERRRVRAAAAAVETTGPSTPDRIDLDPSME